jgi:molybdopterin converting factor small subunit
MSVTVVLPSQLRELAPGHASVFLGGGIGTVGEALEQLRLRHPAVFDRIVTERGEIRPHVNVFVGKESIRWSGGLDTPVEDGAELVILPAVSGG